MIPGLYAKRVYGNGKVVGATINLGCTKGRGSATRMYQFCRQHPRDKEYTNCLMPFITVKNSSNK
jgi:hypothetical protein